MKLTYSTHYQQNNYTRNNHPVNLNLNKSLIESGFNHSIPTKIIIHGYLSNINEQVFTLPKDAYLAQDNYNIIGMDWSALCEFEYFSARKGAQTAGKSLFYFLQFLARQDVSYDDIHLIGHSLGAHVAAMGADALPDGRIGRITGLDPAGPGYSDVAHNLRLDPGDAKLVDVIHTYMRVLSLSEPLGHVDFYPNGGRYQPGCPDIYDILKIPESVMCNHGRAIMYFVESIINSKAFRSKRCQTVEDATSARCFEDSDVYMGNIDTYTTGIYYVRTRSKYPFSY
ncbi:Lipase [Popillia japonica]|uniref:Lipase n=1 Tax=Popillia japonica TaxID=7064 RepID=A0AAW1K425_POPJA